MIATRPEREAADVRSPHSLQFSFVVSEAARRELVSRIVHSPTFGRSERLAALLTYVCEMSLKGQEAEINEQKIGHAVFGRSQSYDSGADGIVRSQASRLRQRLELYFQQEGAEEPVRLVIPRGGYVPVFEAQRTSSSSPSITDPEGAFAELGSSVLTAPNTKPLAGAPLQWRWLPWGVSLVLGLMLVAFWVHDRQHPQLVGSALRTHPFWSHLFTKNEAAIIVAPDSGLVLYHAMSAKDIGLKEYLAAEYRSESNGLPQTGPAAPQQDRLLDLANRRYTSMVDLDAILSLRDKALTLGSDVSVRYARDLRPNDLKKGTVVLLGADTANPWVELFKPNLNFVLKDDYVKTFSVVNRIPQKGEPAAWVSSRDDPQRRAFGVIAYLPNLQGNGNALLVEGTGMSGTEAAMDFLDDDTQLLPFLRQIRRSDDSIPHFELLIETHNMDASAVQTHIIAWRTSK